MKRSAIKLIAADLDGTLLNDDKRISPDTQDAILQLPERGIRFVIASARPPRSVKHIYEALQLDTLQINYNGALIWDEHRHIAVDHRPLDGELVLEIIRFARSLNSETLVTCEILDRWHTDRIDNTYTTATGEMFKPDVIAPVESYCCGPVTKLLLLGPGDVISAMRPLVVEKFGNRINLVSTDRELLQIMAKDVSKAAALRRLVSEYGIPLTNVLAIGDGENDLEMLQECGIGVAVANAAPSLQAIAQWTAPSPNSHGVMDAIRKFIG